MDWLALHIGVRCPATSESRGDQTSIQALYLRLCRKCVGKAVYSGVKVTTLDQLPSIPAPRVKYFVMFEVHVACGIFIGLQWGWVPLWQGDSCREQSPLQIKMCHLSILVAPIRFSLTNKFSRIFTASHYEHATNCLYIQKEGSTSADFYSSSVCPSYFLLPGKLETTQKNTYASTKFPKPQHRYQ